MGDWTDHPLSQKSKMHCSLQLVPKLNCLILQFSNLLSKYMDFRRFTFNQMLTLLSAWRCFSLIIKANCILFLCSHNILMPDGKGERSAKNLTYPITLSFAKAEGKHFLSKDQICSSFCLRKLYFPVTFAGVFIKIINSDLGEITEQYPNAWFTKQCRIIKI